MQSHDPHHYVQCVNGQCADALLEEVSDVLLGTDWHACLLARKFFPCLSQHCYHGDYAVEKRAYACAKVNQQVTYVFVEDERTAKHHPSGVCGQTSAESVFQHTAQTGFCDGPFDWNSRIYSGWHLPVGVFDLQRVSAANQNYQAVTFVMTTVVSLCSTQFVAEGDG